MSRDAPPRWTEWALRRLVPAQDAEPMLGDLAEECRQRFGDGANARAAIARWYARQVLGSIAPLLWPRFRRGAWLPPLGVGLAAYIAAGTVELAADRAVSQLVGPDSLLHTIVILIIGLAALLCAGYVAARTRAGAAAALAAIVLLAVVVLMTAAGESAPFWYQIAFLVAGPAAAAGGGALAGRRRRGVVQA